MTHHNPFPDRDKRFSNWGYRDYLVLAFLRYLHPGARRWDVQRAVRSSPSESAAPVHRAFRRLERAGWIRHIPRQRESARREHRRLSITSAGIAHLESIERDLEVNARTDIIEHVSMLESLTVCSV